MGVLLHLFIGVGDVLWSIDSGDTPTARGVHTLEDDRIADLLTNVHWVSVIHIHMDEPRRPHAALLKGRLHQRLILGTLCRRLAGAFQPQLVAHIPLGRYANIGAAHADPSHLLCLGQRQHGFLVHRVLIDHFVCQRKAWIVAGDAGHDGLQAHPLGCLDQRHLINTSA